LVICGSVLCTRCHATVAPSSDKKWLPEHVLFVVYVLEILVSEDYGKNGGSAQQFDCNVDEPHRTGYVNVFLVHGNQSHAPNIIIYSR